MARRPIPKPKQPSAPVAYKITANLDSSSDDFCEMAFTPAKTASSSRRVPIKKTPLRDESIKYTIERPTPQAIKPKMATIDSLTRDSNLKLLQEKRNRLRDLERELHDKRLLFEQVHAERKEHLIEKQEKYDQELYQIERQLAGKRKLLKDQKAILEKLKRERDQNPQYAEMKRREKYNQDINDSFAAANDTILKLIELLKYNILTESDFEIFAEANKSKSPVGLQMNELIDAFKRSALAFEE